MSRWMIASDLHGDARCTEQLLTRFAESRADRLILLGDLLYHGPRNDLPEGYAPKRVIELLNSVKDSLLCVRGNCDTEVDQMVLNFPILAEYAYLCDGGVRILATHGHTFNLQNLPPLGEGDVLLHGHTHVAGVTKCRDGQLCLNPGSVSIPKAGSAHSYMTLEENVCLWKALDGSVYHTEVL